MTGYNLWSVITVTAVAYLVALPALAWTLSDLRRYPRHLWIGYGNRLRWERTASVSYLVLGVPVLLVALAWRSSLTRRELRALVRRIRSESTVAALPRPAGPSAPAEPVRHAA